MQKPARYVGTHRAPPESGIRVTEFLFWLFVIFFLGALDVLIWLFLFVPVNSGYLPT